MKRQTNKQAENQSCKLAWRKNLKSLKKCVNLGYSLQNGLKVNSVNIWTSWKQDIPAKAGNLHCWENKQKTNIQKNKIDRQTDRQTDRETDRLTNRQINKETDKETHKQCIQLLKVKKHTSKPRSWPTYQWNPPVWANIYREDKKQKTKKQKTNKQTNKPYQNKQT